ncbi:MAG: BBE domain-containing protein [Chloroflexota bacterium]|nr:BBE domain-containing protein [Chloroflexota bacterium]
MVRFPPLPELPPALAGKAFAVVRGAYAGPVEQGAALLRPMRAAAPVVIDAFASMPVGALEKIASDPVDPMPFFSWTETLSDLGPATAQTLLRLYAASPAAPFFAIEARHVGGSAAIRAPRDNAFSLRGAEYVLFVYGLADIPQRPSALPGYLASDAPPAAMQTQRAPAMSGQEPSPEVERAIRGYLATVASALKPHATGLLYYNFLGESDISPERARATHTPAHYQRLATLKAVYDPANMFRYNPNIKPAGPAIAH